MCDITSAIDRATDRLVAYRLVIAIESGRILDGHPAHLFRVAAMIRQEAYGLAVAASLLLGTLASLRDEVECAYGFLREI